MPPNRRVVPAFTAEEYRQFLIRLTNLELLIDSITINTCIDASCPVCVNGFQPQVESASNCGCN